MNQVSDTIPVIYVRHQATSVKELQNYIMYLTPAV